MAEEKAFLGRGWAFPPMFDKTLGTVEMATDIIDIRESIWIYFSTRRRERLMRQNYGSIIHEYIFDNIRGTNFYSLAERLKVDIREFEPRINVVSINVDDSGAEEGIIQFLISYEVIANNVRDNIVFPYYLLEGTHI